MAIGMLTRLGSLKVKMLASNIDFERVIFYVQ